jgi:hypothetical protein
MILPSARPVRGYGKTRRGFLSASFVSFGMHSRPAGSSSSVDAHRIKNPVRVRVFFRLLSIWLQQSPTLSLRGEAPRDADACWMYVRRPRDLPGRPGGPSRAGTRPAPFVPRAAARLQGLNGRGPRTRARRIAENRGTPSIRPAGRSSWPNRRRPLESTPGLNPRAHPIASVPPPFPPASSRMYATEPEPRASRGFYGRDQVVRDAGFGAELPGIRRPDAPADRAPRISRGCLFDIRDAPRLGSA